MPTLADIAQRAGVSPFTVSCALRGTGQVAPATNERIRALAAEMGYVPSAAARLLAEGRRRVKGVAGTPVVALVNLSKAPAGAWSIERNRKLEALALLAGYALRTVGLRDFRSPAEMGRVLWTQGVQGLVFEGTSAPAGFSIADLDGLPWERFAVVKITRGINGLDCASVRPSVFAQTRVALERILAAGYRRIAALLPEVSGSKEDDFSRLGAALAFKAANASRLDALEVWRPASFGPAAQQAARDWLIQFAPQVVLAFPGMAWVWHLEAAGLRIPADFAYVGLPVTSDSPAACGLVVSGPRDDFLHDHFPAALQMLHSELANGRRGLPKLPHEHVLPVVWQAGATLPGLSA